MIQSLALLIPRNPKPIFKKLRLYSWLNKSNSLHKNEFGDIIIEASGIKVLVSKSMFFIFEEEEKKITKNMIIFPSKLIGYSSKSIAISPGFYELIIPINTHKLISMLLEMVRV